MPQMSDLMQLLTELQNDPEQFEAKQKMMDFFISCNSQHALDDCYRETFEYFKPLFGYIVTKNLLNGGSHELDDFLGILDRFVARMQKERESNPVLGKLATYKQKFKTPRVYFHARDLSREYRDVRIYRESYEHNIRNLELHRKQNSTYELGVQRTMLDWSMYLFQSRNKPMSYYYSTFTVHLYMMLFNSRERQRDFTRFREEVECLRLPQFVNVLDEARMLAVIYLKSFRAACSPARDNMSGYVAYGHSMVVNPWAQVQREAGEGCEFIVEEIGECSTIIRDLCKTDCFRFRSVSRRF